MGPTRLFLQDITDEHLTLIARAAEWVPLADAQRWLGEVADGRLELWWTGAGIMALRDLSTATWCEFIVGKGILAQRRELFAFCRARGKPVETMARNAALVRLFSAMGMKPLGTWLRDE